MYEHIQIYKMYIKILRHGIKKKKNIKLVNSNLRHMFWYVNKLNSCYTLPLHNLMDFNKYKTYQDLYQCFYSLIFYHTVNSCLTC
jgi:hypothetical protein